MAKSAESWVKPDDVPGLIGRKKVDLSIFKHGAHIPLEFGPTSGLKNKL